MGPERRPHLPALSYYAPLPTLTVDAGGRIADYNLALEVLLDDDLAGARGLPLGRWLAGLAERVDGVLCPAGLAEGASPERDPTLATSSACLYRTRAFGPARLWGWAVACREPDSGAAQGTALFWEAEPEAGELYRERLLAAIDHQLTWETYAVSYDRVLLEMGYYLEVLRRHVAILSSAEGGRVLDLGAGTGNLALQLLGSCREVVAVERSHAMLGNLRSKLQGREGAAGRLVILEQDAERLPQLEDDSFDGASFMLALYDMRHPESALDEAIRVLRPGGVLVATEPKLSFDLDQILAECRRVLAEKGLSVSLAADLERVNHANLRLDPSTRPTRSPLRAEVLADLLGSRGFEEIGMSDSHLGNCATVRGRKPPSLSEAR